MSLRTVAGRERGVVVDGESQTGGRRQRGKGGVGERNGGQKEQSVNTGKN